MRKYSFARIKLQFQLLLNDRFLVVKVMI